MHYVFAVLITSVIGLGLYPWLCFAQSPGDLNLPKAQVQCIIDRIDAFLDDPDDPVIIYLDLCLSTPDQFVKSITGNPRVDLPTVPMPPHSAGNASNVPSISLPKATLRCLKSASAVPGFPATNPVLLTARCP
jgi:hypothetical protein